jgi:hypothetical protein
LPARLNLRLERSPDFTDYGLGCFLLAGSEVFRLSRD